jgi:cell division protein FtsL
MRRQNFRMFPAVILVFLVLLVYVYFHIASERLAYKIEEVGKMLEKEKNINSQLHMEVSSLSSPERLDKIAKGMKLCSPSKKQIIEIEIKNETSKKK